MSKHTPGPWRSNTAFDTKYLKHVCQGDSNVVARVNGGGVAEETAIADARLIAAAPELLEAAKRMVAYVGENAIREFAEAGNPAHLLIAAIAKAEGKSGS